MFFRSFVGGHLEKGRGEANSEHARLLGGLRKKNPFCGGGMDIFWNYTLCNKNMILL